MTQLTDYFNRDEFACKCGCGFDTVDVQLLGVLTWLREYFGEPVTITSGCRCEEHNANVGGEDQSFHKFGKAADVVVSRISAREVYEALVENFPYQFGFIEYSSWVHIDSREEAYHEEL